MRFIVQKRRQTPAVIIIALIDVLIVMLIFLMATTTFRQHPSLRLALPESTQARAEGAGENVPLVLTVDVLGDFRLGADTKPITADDLLERLEIETLKNPELQLAIRADEGAPFGRIVRVMDVAKEANIKSVNAFTRKPGER